MRFLLFIFSFLLICSVAFAEDTPSVTDQETEEWKQIDKELNSDWDVDLSKSDDETVKNKDNSNNPEEKKDSNLLPFSAGYFLGKMY